ncbi:hypothetical protein GCM10023074_22650 [Microbispora amethystogenes]|uniref:Uncharacterized protein n=1 Tax=Microbispora amethystogenes TaxID=1427754 RepID=A0ABQ4F991_9ACTN|nr:hypothetical protein Mam01_15140 [Microbispora amethystogenes]
MAQAAPGGDRLGAGSEVSEGQGEGGEFLGGQRVPNDVGHSLTIIIRTDIFPNGCSEDWTGSPDLTATFS